MKAIVKFGAGSGDIEYRDVPDPVRTGDKILIRMKGTAICHTDISIIEGEYKGRKPVPIPLIPGHEGAGIVEETFTGSIFKSGDRVAFEPLSGCRICRSCLRGFTNMCADWDHVGITCDGTFAEYILVPERSLHLLPDNIGFDEAAVLEPIGLTARSLENVRPALGDVAVIVGPGAIGLLHLQALKASGCKVLVVGLDQDEKKFRVAKELGADCIINASKVDVVEAVSEFTDGCFADIVIETACAPKALNTAFDIVGVKGRISAFGLYQEVSVKFLSILRKGVTIYGDVGMVSRHFAKGIEWLSNGDIKAKPLISGIYPLSEGVRVIKDQNKCDAIKTVFEI